MSKQDRQPVRNAVQLEQKYKLGGASPGGSSEKQDDLAKTTESTKTSDTTAHLIPGTLFAAKDIPIPVPQHTIP